VLMRPELARRPAPRLHLVQHKTCPVL
jgi:hypothetical protein